MPKNVHMYRLEELTGRDIRQLIHEAVKRHGSVTAAAAEEFGVTRETLRNWIKELDGSVKRAEWSEVSFAGWKPAEERAVCEVAP